MKRKKKLITLLSIFAAICAALIIVTSISKHKENVAVLEAIVLDFEPDEITSFSWTYDDSSYSFVKEDDTWKMENDSDFPVDQDAVDDLLSEMVDYSCTFKIESPSNLADYGLKSPDCTVSFSDGEEEYYIAFGGYSTMDEERYFSVGDGNVYLSDDDIMDDFSLTDADLVQLDEVDTLSSYETLSISGDNTLDVIYEENAGYCYSDLYVYYMKQDGEYVPLSTSYCQAMMKKPSGIDLSTYVTYTADTDDISKYNMDSPNLTVTVTGVNYDDESVTQVVYLSNVGDNYYMRIKDSRIISTIDEETYEYFLSASYDSLAPAEVVNLDWTQAEAIYITLDDETYMISISADDDGNITFTHEGEEVEFDTIIDDIESLSVAAQYSVAPTKSEEIYIKIYLKNESYPSITLRIYQYDSQYCIVKFSGTVKCLVNRSSVTTLIDDINSIVLDW